ncbi:hypothetical protein NUI01_05600 [Corynebacterium sp. MC-17D]|uniref:PPE family protein n=1 Tax=Corynebacterium lipophilum TaxID=2804918 RepID=A0AAW5HXQ7_9CORY|nr:hypothetical protein [Corynebacterium lipophilum]MCO6394611.1 hypothetical protein [Corynebacterium lipophilum]MCZ2117168.1 hypothetical protein [Corynebacterium lipophilum]
MTKILIEVDDVNGAINDLQTIVYGAAGMFTATTFNAGATFSAVSGLREAGEKHGAIYSEHAPLATDAFTGNVKSSAKVLKVCLDNTVMADDSIAGIVNAVGLSGTPGLSGLGSNLGMSSAAAVAKSYKTQPFNNSSVYASTDGSFESLVSNILTTNTAIPSGLASNWTSNAQRIYEMVEAIAPAIASLESSAETEFVAQAIARLQLIQTAGSEYAANSAALAGNNTGLAALASSSQLMAAAAQAAAIAAEAVSPAAVKAVKEAFVSSYPMYVNSYLPATNPTFVKLLPDLTDVTGSDFSISGPPAPTAPEFADAPMPAGLASIFANNGYTDLANARGPQDVLQQFGKPNPDMLNAIASGATPTQVASAQAPTLPPPGALNAPAANVAPGAGLHGGLASGAGGLSGATTGVASAAGSGVGAGQGAFGGMPMGGAGGGGRHRAGSLHQQSAGFGSSAGSGSGSGSATGFGSNAGLAGGGAGGFAGRPGAGSTGGFGGQTSAASAAGSFTNTAGQQGQRGGFMGAPMSQGRGKDDKKQRPKAVTSAVEREGNIHALLGDAPLVNPGVIGFNVRGQ